jgi:WhiB family redox-sensing transcriptional regulator
MPNQSGPKPDSGPVLANAARTAKLAKVSTGPAELTTELAAEWRERAACSGYRHALFFPVGDTDTAAIERAISICLGCAVIDDCLEYALETNQRAGIWGGTTEEERRSLRRKWLATRRRIG